MNTSTLLKYAAIAALVVTPVIAGAAPGPVEQCMNTFVAQNFPNTKATFVVEHQRDSAIRLPLELNSGSYEVVLKANDRNTGKLLGTATCAVKHNFVSLGEITAAP